MREQQLTRIVFSRGGAMVLGLLALVGAWFALKGHDYTVMQANSGLMFPSPNRWAPTPMISLGVNVALCLGIAGLMVALNRTFNMLRNTTMLYAGLFLLFEAATPALFLQLSSSTVIGFVVLGASMMLFSYYDRDTAISARRIFLIYALLSLGALATFSMAFYMPIFLLGCAQMRILNLRMLLAALFGILAPPWIVLGLGIVQMQDIQMPHFVNLFAAIDLGETLALLVTVGITALLGVAAWLLNLMKLLGYNALTRSMNGFVTLLTLATPILMAVDYTHLIAYVTVLNWCAAFQISHYLTGTLGGVRGERNYIIVFVIVLVYISLYLWRIAI